MEKDNIIPFHSRAEREQEKVARAQETSDSLRAKAEQQAAAYGPPVPIDVVSFVQQLYAAGQKEGREKRLEQLAILDTFDETLQQACNNQPVVIFATNLFIEQGQPVFQLIERHGICDEVKIGNARSNWYQTNDRDAHVEPRMLGYEDLDIAVCPYLSDGNGGWRINESIEPLYIPAGAIIAINFESKPGPRLSAV